LSDPSWRGREEQLGDRRIHVLAVEDQLQRDAGIFQRGHHRTRRAVVDAGHRIKGVRQHPGSRIEGRSRRVEVGFGVPDGDRDAGGDQRRNELEGAGQFGRERDLPQRAASRRQQ